MKKFALTAALVLVSPAFAGGCANHDGFANGLIKRPASLVTDCGLLYSTFQKSVVASGKGSVRWSEGYQSTANEADISQKIGNSLKEKGFSLKSQEKTKGGNIYTYTNDKIRKIIMMMIFDKKVGNFIAVAGN